MSQTIKGALDLVVDNGKPAVIRLNPDVGRLYVGEKQLVELVSGEGGAVWLRTDDGTLRVSLRAYGNGLAIQDGDGNNVVHLNCEEQVLAIGGNKKAGAIMLRDGEGNATATIASDTGGLSVGGSLEFRMDEKQNQAVLRVGHGGRDGVVELWSKVDGPTVVIDGEKGDITLPKGADCAEDFDLASGTAAEPGMVVVIGDDGCIRPSQIAYDSRVIGVVSGAGSLRPGLVLDRRPRDGAHATVGLMGKVYCRVDAGPEPIRAGALLVSADRIGHAQAAGDRARAFGAVVGKALGRLDSGQGLIPVLLAVK